MIKLTTTKMLQSSARHMVVRKSNHRGLTRVVKRSLQTRVCCVTADDLYFRQQRRCFREKHLISIILGCQLNIDN